MLEYAKLELRKNRLLTGGLAGAFVVTLPIPALVAPLAQLKAAQSVHAALAFWTAFGVAVLAAFLGGASGGELRSQPSCAAEAPLPISPRGRAFGALAA